MKKIYFQTILILLCFSMVNCTGNGESSVADVEVDIFSGRPNPTFEITSDDLAELKTQLGQLPELDNGSMPEISLGFRGFIIQGIELDHVEQVSYIRVYEEFVAVYDKAEQSTLFYDEDKVVSQILEATFSVVDPDLHNSAFGSNN